MLTQERHAFIMKKLGTAGRVLSSELSRKLRVSEDTIRRDLRQLSESGLLLKVHGGAVPRSNIALEFNTRAREQLPEKRSIAAAATRFLRPGTVVIFDGGTSALEVARAAPRDLAFTAVTHSPLAAVALAGLPLVEVHLIGGKIFKRGIVSTGPDTVDGYRKIRADTGFFGVACIDVEAGLTDPSHEEAAVRAAMIENTATTVILATSDKLGKVSHFVVAPTSTFDHLVTDSGAPARALAAWRAAGVDVLVAPLP
ncbi:MAG: DeoR/GlpR family DNA-binding transcription regulator [Opitutaceae bacterium]|nr:DeoR/GlpR family DNA-binding transcription regulator [Opitutaceae bacterium]